MPDALDTHEYDASPDRPDDYDAPLAVDGADDFLEVKLPKEFVIVDDSGAAEGIYYAADFDRDEETGAYLCQTEGRLLILRVVEAFDNDTVLHCVDGGGRLWRYRLVKPGDEDTTILP